jgi:hypothetical protein
LAVLDPYITISAIMIKLIIALAVLLAAGLFWVYRSDQAADGGETHFRGRVTDIDTGCYVDGICAMTIAGKRVIFGQGMTAADPPVGQLIGVPAPEQFLGKEVEVYGRLVGNSGTIIGRPEYYIKIVE